MFMRIGIIKPDYKIIGGFEVVVNTMKHELEGRGHDVELVYVDVTDTAIKDIPYSIDQENFQKNPDFFRYVNNYWKYLKMNLNQFDSVISTQPPSFAVQHSRHISLFYHHMKVYYDMSDLIQEVGLQQPFHQKAVEVIREIDSLSLSNVSTILAGSQTIKQRIQKYNNLTKNVDVLYAGIDKDIYDYDGPISYNSPIVVGRHEFPKRPELFVAAMKKIPNQLGKVVGVGGRTEDLKKIDQLLTYTNAENINISDELLWKKMSNGFFLNDYAKLLRNSKKNSGKSNVIFTGRLSRNELFHEYANALCVVCPAFEEDYGLTAIEAMAFKKPVIACKDGGGYTELIQHGINGFVVEPSSDGIAQAIRAFVEEPNMAVKMGKNAYEFSRKFSWEQTSKKLMDELQNL
jgi:glycosyltransferase involved in cell wall biosynthesis